MASENETVEDIAAHYRAVWQGCENVDASEYDGKDILRIVDRFESAWRRERKQRRNCDRFANGDDAFYAFDNECKLKHIKPCRAGKKMCTGHDSIHCFKDWIFATVAEGGES